MSNSFRHDTLIFGLGTYDFSFWRLKKPEQREKISWVVTRTCHNSHTVWPEIDKVFSKTKCIQHFSELPQSPSMLVFGKVWNKPDYFFINLDLRN